MRSVVRMVISSARGTAGSSCSRAAPAAPRPPGRPGHPAAPAARALVGSLDLAGPCRPRRPDLPPARWWHQRTVGAASSRTDFGGAATSAGRTVRSIRSRSGACRPTAGSDQMARTAARTAGAKATALPARHMPADSILCCGIRNASSFHRLEPPTSDSTRSTRSMRVPIGGLSHKRFWMLPSSRSSASPEPCSSVVAPHQRDARQQADQMGRGQHGWRSRRWRAAALPGTDAHRRARAAEFHASGRGRPAPDPRPAAPGSRQAHGRALRRASPARSSASAPSR